MRCTINQELRLSLLFSLHIIQFAQGRIPNLILPSQGTAVTYKYALGFLCSILFIISDRQDIGIRRPTICLNPRVAMHQSSICQLVEIDIRHLITLGHTDSNPIISLSLFKYRQILILRIIF